jgi:hypothetical protein
MAAGAGPCAALGNKTAISIEQVGFNPAFQRVSLRYRRAPVRVLPLLVDARHEIVIRAAMISP